MSSQSPAQFNPEAPASRLAFLAVPLLALVLSSLAVCKGLVYSLDDAYTHLALARNILAGHYGINLTEVSAPSSSILWPFLLAPAAATGPFFELAPLFLGSASALATGLTLWGWLEGHLEPAQAKWGTVALMFCLNHYGLVMTGMEHSLQVLLTVVVAVHLVGARLGWAFWLSIVLLPLVRYEGLAVSVPVLLFLSSRRSERRRAALALGFITLVMLGFSVFLHRSGVGWLPSSVLAKSPVFVAEDPWARLWTNLEANLLAPATVLSAALALVGARFLARRGGPGRAGLTLLAPVGLHLLFGKSGWFGRYEAALATYVVVVSLDGLLPERTRLALPARRALGGLGLAATAPLWSCTLASPLGSRNIGDQQLQMAIIVERFLDRSVAVNDLGQVSFRSRRYVLDLGGLGSPEVLRHRWHDASSGWLGPLMAAKDVHFAFVYEAWFPEVPLGWIRVGTLSLPSPRVTPVASEVALFATDAASSLELHEALKAYQRSSEHARSMLALVK